MKAELFAALNGLNVNEHTEKKTTGGKELTYLSWAWAWAEFLKICPDAQHEIVKNPMTGLPFFFAEGVGYIVYTNVTVEGDKKEMWLPVMDGANRAMLDHPYTVKNKYGKESVVEAATMTDINRTIMRCLTKNLALFGLGLYIYAGEDTPEGDETDLTNEAEPKTEKKSEPKATVRCERCDSVITGTVDKNGKLMTAAQVVGLSKLRYHGVYCPKCMKALEVAKNAEGE